MHRDERAQAAPGATNSGHLGHLTGVLLLAVVAACATFVTCAQAAPPVNPSAILRIHPGGGPVRFGDSQSVEVEASAASGAGLDGVQVDFEVTGGPGDLDGNTPQTPDMTCTTAGGDQHHAATCAVSYGEPQNRSGSDAVLAWIDADQQDSTVEADLGEGENENAPGSGGCSPGTKGPGGTPEPDPTDCAEKRWFARTATTVELEPNASAGPTGSQVGLAVTVLDQFGSPVGSLPGTAATVSFELLAGSAHDAGDGSDFASADLGSCVSDANGGCSVPFTATTAGTDIVCAYVAGRSAACSQTPDAAGAGAGADVVTRSWEAPAPPPAPQPGTSTPPAQAPPAEPPVPEAPASESSDPPPPGKHPPSKDHHPGKPTSPAQRTDERHARDVKQAGPRPEPARPLPEPAHPAAPPGPAPHAQRVRRHLHRGGHHARRRVVRGQARVAALMRRAGDEHSGWTASADPPPAARPAGHSPHRTDPPAIRRLSEAALTTAHKLSFPLLLTLLVIAFLIIQSRLDRRDPKLRLAPVDSAYDLLPFA